MHTEASLNYIHGSISESSARAPAKHLSNRRSTYAIICNMPTLSHTFLASLHEGFSDLPKHKRVSGHPQLLLQSLLRVSVRPTTSFYRGFQCDPQLPFIEGFSATHNFLLSHYFLQLFAPANHSVIIIDPPANHTSKAFDPPANHKPCGT
jgi:hypothetical protein